MYWNKGLILGIIFTQWFVLCFGQNEGDVRLINGEDDLSGFVEIYHSNQWGRVCNQGWGVDSSIVTCVQLGHNGALDSPSIPQDLVRPASGQVWLLRVTCMGDDTMVPQQARLVDCPGGQTWLGSGTTNPCESAYVNCVPYGKLLLLKFILINGK
ncbi:scavenger receptor cysteine-rich domain-containing protein SCART1-like [Lytechinus variegatus]|uniref:scavenger receptor cysteine-rich domain-containing protein SCART1-like n=1 Tax=Lytechinus variegatus TaxID=7654 RepID=UPI001BB2C47B|nr:scavenger receptor cysteine-rich domain-containing protein SCART1-like [Lytechinus variegatus]